MLRPSLAILALILFIPGPLSSQGALVDAEDPARFTLDVPADWTPLPESVLEARNRALERAGVEPEIRFVLGFSTDGETGDGPNPVVLVQVQDLDTERAEWQRAAFTAARLSGEQLGQIADPISERSAERVNLEGRTFYFEPTDRILWSAGVQILEPGRPPMEVLSGSIWWNRRQVTVHYYKASESPYAEPVAALRGILRSIH